MNGQEIKANSVKEAKKIILNSIKPITKTEIVNLDKCINRILKNTLSSKRTQPSFDTSSMDGYAISKKDIKKIPLRLKIKDEIKAAIEEAERDKENSTVQRFIRNFESRVYAELSRQLIANLFGETPSDSGILELEGNIIEYEVVDGIITLRITDSDGNTTVISLPIGSFTF